ncbi:FAD-dependent oxidoreductase [Pedobacter cryoconitis]|uniref:Flavin-dependent monooxygenase n=1 Tax=Pedobacter cryoconitis TaxID=188932 RepID=A0A327STD2_9SPHI|nr:NAD(P)/FAD-dependent oxidoreductase [Pedobacter cryoconitis]RAJ32169.1 2-polyprenyl-6-methoxyphenol hydroxylase-like FAD-dependent oxidoreductase [Pedobacter cryoconitis]
MWLQNKKVAIVGGGPGGLTLARLLQLKGIEVKVYERSKDKSADQQGATLDLHYESGLKALRECGLMEEFKKNYRPGADRLTITDQYAALKFSEAEEGVLLDLNSEYARPEIDRGPLRNLLIEALQEGTVVWDAHCTELKKGKTGWGLVFENGTVACADLVVAADGAHSKIRKYITAIRPVYSGITIVEGNIYNAAVYAPNLWKLTNGGKVFAMGSCKTIVLSAKGEGSLSFYTGTSETEGWAKSGSIDFKNKEEILTWFKQRFSDWSVDWQEAFLADESYFIARPQYCFPVDQSWQALPDLTMIGDVAHVMPPFAGEGVNQAMQDALELYEALCLTDFNSLQEAIAAFEKKMCSRTSAVTVDTLLQTEALHAENSLQYLLDMFNQFRD